MRARAHFIPHCAELQCRKARRREHPHCGAHARRHGLADDDRPVLRGLYAHCHTDRSPPPPLPLPNTATTTATAALLCTALDLPPQGCSTSSTRWWTRCSATRRAASRTSRWATSRAGGDSRATPARRKCAR